MKKINLGQTLQFLGNIGIFIGILLLVYELQQNNELLSAQGRADREVVRREAGSRYLENPALISATVKANNGEPLTEEEAVLLDYASRAALWDWQYIVREYRLGLLDADVIPHDAWTIIFREDPGIAEFWSKNPEFFEPEFIQWMEENVVDADE